MSSGRIDAPHTRASHRLVCIFTLDRVKLKVSPRQLQDRPPLVDRFELERFERNFKSEAAQMALPRVLGERPVDSLYWPRQIGGVKVTRTYAIVVAAPVGGEVLALMTIDFSGELMEVIPMLSATAMGRDNMYARLTSPGKRMLLGYALARVIPCEVADTDRAGFGPDVHQLVFPSDAATPELVTPAIGGGGSGPNLDRISRIVLSLRRSVPTRAISHAGASGAQPSGRRGQRPWTRRDRAGRSCGARGERGRIRPQLSSSPPLRICDQSGARPRTPSVR